MVLVKLCTRFSIVQQNKMNGKRELLITSAPRKLWSESLIVVLKNLSSHLENEWLKNIGIRGRGLGGMQSSQLGRNIVELNSDNFFRKKQ